MNNLVNDNNSKSTVTLVLDIIKETPQQKQVQYDLVRQLRELRIAANKLGLYDAANFIKLKRDY